MLVEEVPLIGNGFSERKGKKQHVTIVHNSVMGESSSFLVKRADCCITGRTRGEDHKAQFSWQ